MKIEKAHKEKIKRVMSVTVIALILISISSATVNGGEVDYSENLETSDGEDTSRASKSDNMIEDERVLFEDADIGEGAGKHSSIDISEDHRYISYYSESDEALKLAVGELPYAYDDWTIWTLDDQGDVGRYSSMEVVSVEDEEGNEVEVQIHVAYYDVAEKRLKYTLWTHSKGEMDEEKKQVVDSGEVGKYASLALDNDKDPHISYHNENTRSLMYAALTDTGWESEEVTAGGEEGVGLFTSLALRSDKPRISHHDADNFALMYSKKDGGEWSTETIDAAGERAGTHTSLVLDVEGDAHISCHGWTDEDYTLQYVTNVSGAWKAENVDKDTDFVGTYTSIDLYNENDPVISYHDWDEENLRLAWKDENDEWSVRVVDQEGHVGSHSSLVVGDKGVDAHISYHDRSEEDLLYARVFLKDRTPLAPENFTTRSEYGDIILEWEPPVFDGLCLEEDGIQGYNIYRKNESDDEEGFEMIEEKYDPSSNTYRDEIPQENETDDYLYMIAAENENGEGDPSPVLRTRARYFNYTMIGPETNEYELGEPFSLVEGVGEVNTNAYEVRWDFDHNRSEGAEWDGEKTGFEGTFTHTYEDVGLKSVMLEIEGSGVERRCLQSAWVLGEYDLTSTYEKEDSNEVFFNIRESFIPEGHEEKALINTYIFEGHKDLPYRAINFTFEGYDESSEGGDDLERPVSPDKIEGDRAVWEHNFTVSDARQDTEVIVEPLLYNEHTDSYDQPFASDFDERENESRKDVPIIEMMEWVYPLLNKTSNMTVENVEEDGYYHGWELEFEVDFGNDSEGDKFFNVSSVMQSQINKLGKYFGGDYGFEVEVWPDNTIKLSNNGVATTRLLTFSTDVGEDKLPSGEFEGDLGKSTSYSGNVDTGVSINIHVDMIVDPFNKRVEAEGILEAEFDAMVKIDIPLQSIGIAEVGLTAEVGGGIGVEFTIGSLAYEYGEGVSPKPPSEVLIDMIVEFGGGPYAEVGAGLARVEGKFICTLTVGLQIPSMDRDLGLEGEFEVVAEALWGLWEKSKSWELFSVEPDLALSQMMHDIEADKSMEIFSTDRLYTRNYDSVGEDLRSDPLPETTDGVTTLEDNVAPNPKPDIAFIDNETGLAAWSELSLNGEGVDSELYTSVYEQEGWGQKEAIENQSVVAYDPELVKLNEEELIMFYMGVDKEVKEENAGEQFFENNSLMAKTWSPIEGWSETLFNYTVEGESISGYDISLDGSNYYIAYRTGGVHFDMLNSTTAVEGTVGLIKAEMNQNGLEVIDNWTREELMPLTSTPSVESFEGDTGLSYITYEDGEGDENCYNETVLVEIDESVGSLEDMNNHSIRKTENTTSHSLISREDDHLVVSWVENHSSIRRREVLLESSGWTLSDIETVYSGRTVSNLDFYKNESGKFYTFQGGENAVPMIIQSKDEGWGYLRSISLGDKYTHGQSDHDFNIGSPKMIYVEEEDVIEDWHKAHYSFNRIKNDMVEDESEHENTGYLEGNYSIEEQERDGENDMVQYGHYVQFKDEADGNRGMMNVSNSPSLNVTEESEDFTVTSYLNFSEKDDVDGYLYLKEGSWGIKYEDDSFVVELWSNSEKETKEVIPQDLDVERWFFLGVRYEHGHNDISYLNVTLVNQGKNLTHEDFMEHTDSFELVGFGELDSSTEDLNIGECTGTLAVDDFRLVNRYLPDASMMKIYNTPFPNFDRKRSIETQAVPPFVNFTVLNQPVVDNVTEFQGYSPSSDLNWTWTFDGEEKRYGKNIDHVFKETGFQKVRLEAVDNQTGARSYHEETIQIIDITPPEFDGIEETTVLENNSVKLEWEPAEDSSEPIRYRVHRSEGEQNIDDSVWEKSTENTSIVLEELDPYVIHNIKVTAENRLGLVNTTAPVVNISLEDHLSPEFDGLRSVYTSDHSNRTISLEWNTAFDHSEPITYHIYHSRDENMSFEDPIDTTEETRFRVSVSDLGRHYFAVRAEDDEGNMEMNQIVKDAIVNDTKPPDVEITEPKAGDQVLSTVQLEWEADDEDSGISRYHVKADNWDTYRILDTNATEATFTLFNLPDGERTLDVKAVDKYGNHAIDSVEVEVEGIYESPTAEVRSPKDNSQGISTSSTLNVDIEHPNGLQTDVHFYSGEEDLIGVKEGVEHGDTAVVNWTGLEVDTEYEWFVRLDDGLSNTSSEIWSFTTSESGENNPPEIIEKDPADGSEEEALNTTLEVEVFDKDGDTMDVTFYSGEGDVIGEGNEIISGDEASTKWKDLSPGTTYEWFVEVEDGFDSTTSETWSFKTVEKEHEGPDKPYDPRPENGSTDVSIPSTLEVKVEHPDEESMTVSFYGTSESKEEFELIGIHEDVESGTTASTVWNDLEEGTEYQWYAVADDGVKKTTSDVWSFETATASDEEDPGAIEVREFRVDPIYGETPLEVSITAQLENQNASQETIDLEITGDEGTVRSWTFELEPNEVLEVSEEHEIQESGEYTVIFGEEEEQVTVVEEMNLKPISLEVPDAVYTGKPARIEAVVENQGDEELKAYLLAEGIEILAESIPADSGEYNLSTECTFEEVGEKKIEVRDENDHTLMKETIEVQTIRPDDPEEPRPKPGSKNISTSPTLSVKVSHPEERKMDISFYNEKEGESVLIDSAEDVSSGKTASVEWNGLKNSTTYHWFVVVDDGEEETFSETWRFTTSETGENTPPDPPSLMNPEDGVNVSSTDVALKVEISDVNSENLDVLFYDKEDEELIGEVSEVSPGSEAEIVWENLSQNATYEWFVVVDDGEHTTTSEVWSFTTDQEDSDDGSDGKDDDRVAEGSSSSLSALRLFLLILLIAAMIVTFIFWYNNKKKGKDEREVSGFSTSEEDNDGKPPGED
ncbi:MAG: hypothetical protein ACOCTR_05165 [Candidatus Natronoplasma sp.]